MKPFVLRISAVVYLVTCFGTIACSQVVVGFQGGEPGNTWGYTSTGASAIALGEALLAPNKTAGTTSLVVGGNTGGGSCFSGGSGNGPSVARTFTFNALDISSSNQSVRTLRFNWGNRYPSCNGTGWDSGEDLVFRAYYDGVPQAPVTIIVGSGNAPYSIQANQYIQTIPSCISSFYFTVGVTTNRADELLFIDDVTLTAPQLNQPASPLTITGAGSVCQGSTQTYSVPSASGATYSWSVSPAGPVLSTPNGNSSISVNWATAAPGNYTISVVSTLPCSTVLPASTYVITVLPPTSPVTISGPTAVCEGQSITLTSDHSTGNEWSTTQTTQSIAVTTAGTYSVTVDGFCGTQTDSHTVILGSGPVISSLIVTDVSCNGNSNGSVSLTAAGTNLEYSTDGINWQTSQEFNNLAPGNYTFSLRENGGCVSDTTLTITEPQVVIAQVSTNGPVCEGQLTTLTGTSSVSPATFSWSGPNSYFSSLQNPADVTFAGVYTLITTVNGCSSEPVQITVTLKPVPVATASSATNYCEGQSITLTGNSSIIQGATFSWSGPAGYNSSQQNATGISVSGNYSLVVTVNGCSGNSSPATVFINPQPDASASYNAPYCPGTILQLNGATTSLGAPQFNWTGPGGYTSPLQNPSNATETGIYTLVVTVNGCASLPASTAVVNESPEITVSNNGPYCFEETVQLSGAVVSSQTPSYSWTGPQGYISALQSPSDATVSGIYTLTATINSCVVSASTIVTIFPETQIDFTATEVCEGLTTVFQAQSNSQIESFNWILGDGAEITGAAIEHIYGTAGTFNVHLNTVDFNGCVTDAEKSVTVHKRPEALFSIQGDEISDLDLNVVFENRSNYSTQYEWWFAGADELVYDFEPVYDFSQTDNYTVRLVATNEIGCTDTMTRILSKVENPLYFVPNAFSPNGDEFNNVFQPVFTQGFDPQNYRLAIYNRWGELLFESKDAGIGWDGSFKGELMAAGTYTWQLTYHRSDSGTAKNIQGHLSLLR